MTPPPPDRAAPRPIVVGAGGELALDATPWWRHRGVLASVATFALITLAGVFVAKWWPYAHKLVAVAGAHAFPGQSILASAGAAGAAPTWHGTVAFTLAYLKDIWVALLAALFIGAGVETLLPRSAIVGRTGRSDLRASLRGGLVALPCMMCTCCGAPITASLRRSGAPVATALSYWLGNPLLNPAVVAFLAFVLPWRYALARVLVGALVVFAIAPAIARLAPRAPEVAGAAAPAGDATIAPASQRAVPLRYLFALMRLAVTLVPEYVLVVLAIGALRGWLFPLGHDATSLGVLAALIAAAAGALVVVPTAGEIPIVVGLLASGFSPLVAGAALIALPALSLPSMAMVGRFLGLKVTLATLAAVIAAALVGGALVGALGA